MKKKRLLFIVPLAIAGVLAFIAVGGLIVSLLWNWLTPALFGWKHITWVQAVALLALCRILFGGFGPGRGFRPDFRRRMRERWEHMTPEERDRFREGMRARCGFGQAGPEGQPQ